MRPRLSCRGERGQPSIEYSLFEPFNAATAELPWRTFYGIREEGGAARWDLQCGHG
jgi:hypothetical protein